MTAFSPRSDFLRILTERGFLHQCTDWEQLDRAFLGNQVTAYVGFDATADSLHVGHLLSIMALRWLQITGHRPIVLMGGGTTRIGDPSFRDSTRPLLDDAQIADNIAGIRRVFEQFLDFSPTPNGAVMVNNAEWLDKLAYIPFLRDFGRHFTVNRMLAFDSVKQRLDREQALTFLEFNYMLLQAFDFVELSRRYGCHVQMGGSDQWGNIINGVELGRRIDGSPLFGLTTTLLTTASGSKMGKTAGGAVWLNPDRLTPYEFWQFWRNTEDPDVGRFLRLFTDLPLSEISRLETLAGQEINEAKKRLATEVTALVHGRDAARAAEETARRVFESGSPSDGLPVLEIERRRLAIGIPLVDLLVRSALAPSKGEARRLIIGGGTRIDGTPITDAAAIITLDLTRPDAAITLSVGKKRHVAILPRCTTE